MKHIQVGSTNKQNLLWVFQKTELTRLKDSCMYVMSNVSNTGFIIRYFLQYLLQVAEVKKYDLCFERVRDRPGNRHFFPTTYQRLCIYL